MYGSNKNKQFDPEVIHWHFKVVPIPANHCSQTANGLVLCIVRARLAGGKCISIEVSSPNVAQTDPMTIALVETWLELWVPMYQMQPRFGQLKSSNQFQLSIFRGQQF